jgi:hypothetical protein
MPTDPGKNVCRTVAFYWIRYSFSSARMEKKLIVLQKHCCMTALTYDYLQQEGFKLLIPIVSQNQNPDDLELVMWGKEINSRVIRLEYHKTEHNQAENDKAPFHPDGLKLFSGEKNEIELHYEATIFYEHELVDFIRNSV